MWSMYVHRIPIPTRPGSIRLCPGQSPTDVDGSFSTVTKAHWISSSAFIHMAGRHYNKSELLNQKRTIFIESYCKLIARLKVKITYNSFRDVNNTLSTCPNMKATCSFFHSHIFQSVIERERNYINTFIFIRNRKINKLPFHILSYENIGWWI